MTVTERLQQVPMAILRRPHLISCLRFRHLHRCDYVNNKVMVKPNLQQLSAKPSKRLCIHPFQRRKVALFWLYHLFVSPGR